ncbi:MAG: hexitol phosphatase HxpB [Ignavibacteria bacterium]|nr:hexitol phosphatase HxpB [Ignavibacteria bacterium]
MIKAVIYDMDGLILDSEPFWKEAETKVFGSVGVPLTPQMCETTVGKRLKDVSQYWHEKNPWNLSETPLEKVNSDIIDELIALIRSKGTLNKGVTGSFEYFGSKNLPLALASSSDMKIIDAVMDKFGIREIFSVIHTAEFEEYGKPHPAIYINTAKAMNVKPNDCLAIEDSFYGLISAIAAGMKTIAVPELTNFYNPKFDIASLKLRSLKDLSDEEFSKLDKL